MPPHGGGGHGGGSDFHEEDYLGKVYDSRLISRLLKYAKPYIVYIIITVIFLILLSLSRIYKPYLIKEAIDKDIVLPYLMMDLTGMDKENKNYYMEKYKNKAIRSENPGKLLIESSRLDLKDSSELRKTNSLSKERYLYIRKDYFSEEKWIKVEKLIAEKANSFIPMSEEGSYAITQENLSRMSSSDNFMLKAYEWNDLKRITVIYFIILAIGFLLEFSQFYLITWLGQKVMHDIRGDLFKHLTKLTINYFDSHPIGRLVTRVTNDVGTLHEMFTSVLINITSDVFLLIGIIVTIFILDWKLALLLMGIMPVIIFATIMFRIKFRTAYRQVRRILARINATLSEHFSGIRVIKVFARERENFRKFDEVNQSYYKVSMKELFVNAIFSPVIVVANNLGLALIIWYGGGQVIQDAMPLGILVAFLTYSHMFFQPINAIAEKYNIMQSAMAASERIFQIMDEKDEFTDEKDCVEIKDCKGSVEFKNVSFAYKKDEWVLRNLSFKVEAGKTLAIVGATGAGKTTIISLLVRFYEPQEGEILLDGIDIRKFKKKDLRRHLSLVLQDVFLFTGNIADNIRLNNKEITDEQVKAAALYVNADHFIQKIDGGYEGNVAERGSTLSMGQRQLLAFARALAFNPRILILDEATSSIDTETEQLIQDALLKLMEGRTSLVIAHRLSTIQHANNIIVMHKGEIVEEGTHQELLASRGIYFRLYQLQYKGQVPGLGKGEKYDLIS
ncbi:MAG: ABC transporter ATP-binding protein [Candidatus Coatesbacteria bacterium]|nr:ABC transporter ATP-binding protein [Candidatus Coatesbacteria bacterium]